jgi:hypothetical protein
MKNSVNTFAVVILTLGFVAPLAVASDGPAGWEVNNHNADYPVMIQKSASTKAFGAIVVKPDKTGRVGAFIDETPEESNQRSSNH